MSEKELWTSEKRLSYLPSFPRELFIQEAEFLYEDLLNNHSKIVLSIAPIQKHADHKIRVVSSCNPPWYSFVYNSHNRGRRKSFEKSLWRLVNRLDMDFKPNNNYYIYDTTFRHLIYSRFVEGYPTEEGLMVFPNNDVRAFFNLEKIEIPCEF